MNFWPFRRSADVDGPAVELRPSMTDAVKEAARDPHADDCGIRTRGTCDCEAEADLRALAGDWRQLGRDFMKAALDWQSPPLPLADSTSGNKRIREQFIMQGAEWHAFRAQQLEAAGDEQEARLHLGDAAEYLTQIGGPNRVQSAEEIYQYCAARRAGEK